MVNEALRLVRIFHDKSQSDVCRELGVSNSYLSELESGKKQPTLEFLQKFAAAFDLPVSSLLFFSEELHASTKTKNVRRFLAKKAVTLLKWVEDKDKPRKRDAEEKTAA